MGAKPMTNNPTHDYSGLVERLGLHNSWRDSHGELNDAPNQAKTAIKTLTRELAEMEIADRDQASAFDQCRSELTATKERLADAVGFIQKIANQSKCDEFDEDEREDLDFIGGYGFIINESRTFLAKQEASHDR
jgi:hypothetical protein